MLNAGQQLLEWRNSGVLGGQWVDTQFKSEADILANNFISEKLKLLTPNIPIISEESADSWVDDRPELYWLIDPIDGTASFTQGFSGFVTQVALMVQHKPLMAIVYAPEIKNLYTAVRGQGAFLNNKRLSVKGVFPPRILIDNYPAPRDMILKAYVDLKMTRYIECGSIALKICMVADGTADLFFKTVIVRDWDLAAPQLVLEEAGGSLKDIYGNPIEYAGGYEKAGVVAACHPGSLELLIKWHSDFIKKMKTVDQEPN